MSTASPSPTLRWVRAAVAGTVTAVALTGCAPAPTPTPTNGTPMGIDTVGTEVATCLTAGGWDVTHVSADGLRVDGGLAQDQHEDVQLAWSDCAGTPATFSVPFSG